LVFIVDRSACCALFIVCRIVVHRSLLMVHRSSFSVMSFVVVIAIVVTNTVNIICRLCRRLSAMLSPQAPVVRRRCTAAAAVCVGACVIVVIEKCFTSFDICLASLFAVSSTSQSAVLDATLSTKQRVWRESRTPFAERERATGQTRGEERVVSQVSSMFSLGSIYITQPFLSPPLGGGGGRDVG
jgi:hypothetical protein